MQAADGAPAQGAEEPAVGGAPAVDGAAVGDGEWGLEGSHVDSLPHLTEGEGIGGILKARNADFVVEEVLLPGVPDGKEGFIVVAVEREGAATADVQKQLAALFGIKDPSKVAYAGLKDKDAVVIQHFSLPLGPGSVSKDKVRTPEQVDAAIRAAQTWEVGPVRRWGRRREARTPKL
ncbi:tRNA pseudouridine synthase D-domain-containing protein [Baffinella frigidus]|nr:tRNA pseudouridine synthase D-domain-containing protein [Cryptophyta sp. CCMP2293]